MSVYNDARFLDEAIRSILEQTFDDYEFIIIDDGSTDRSRGIIKLWADRDSRIRPLFRGVNSGLAANLNWGIEQAKGSWIARMDADDVALPYRLERQMRFLNAQSDIDIVGSYTLDIDEKGQVIQERTCPTDHDDIQRLIWTCPLIHPTVVFRKDLIVSTGGYDPSLRRRQDYDLWFRCSAAGATFANIPEILLKYRFTPDYYRKNGLSVAIQQARIGWRGCRLVNAGLRARIGVATPIVRAVLPGPLQAGAKRLLSRFDPRLRINTGKMAR